jgi:membrane associated rhomboid family serine protease
MIPVRDNIRRRSVPFVTVILILFNILVFGFQVVVHGSLEVLVDRFAAVPAHVTHAFSHPLDGLPVFATLFTSMFLHGGVFHLLGNMLYLWIFGDNVEDRLGHGTFLLFYLLCGSIAGLTHILLHPSSTIPMVGASGAIAGVLGAYVLLYPFARVQVVIPLILLFPVVQIPALFFLGGWFIIQLISGYTARSQELIGGVAWWAHAGGFVTGVLWIILLRFGRK